MDGHLAVALFRTSESYSGSLRRAGAAVKQSRIVSQPVSVSLPAGARACAWASEKILPIRKRGRSRPRRRSVRGKGDAARRRRLSHRHARQWRRREGRVWNGGSVTYNLQMAHLLNAPRRRRRRGDKWRGARVWLLGRYGALPQRSLTRQELCAVPFRARPACP